MRKPIDTDVFNVDLDIASGKRDPDSWALVEKTWRRLAGEHEWDFVATDCAPDPDLVCGYNPPPPDFWMEQREGWMAREFRHHRWGGNIPLDFNTRVGVRSEL